MEITENLRLSILYKLISFDTSRGKCVCSRGTLLVWSGQCEIDTHVNLLGFFFRFQLQTSWSLTVSLSGRTLNHVGRGCYVKLTKREAALTGGKKQVPCKIKIFARHPPPTMINDSSLKGTCMDTTQLQAKLKKTLLVVMLLNMLTGECFYPGPSTVRIFWLTIAHQNCCQIVPLVL